MDIRLEHLLITIESATKGMSEQELVWHSEEKWSASDILEHLLLTYTGTIKGLERCRQGSNTSRAPSLRDRFRSALVLQVGYFPAGRKAPANTCPRGTPLMKVMSDIPTKIAVLDQLLNECEAQYGKGVRILDHPILGPFRAQQWRKFHLAHGRHHMEQIHRLRASYRSSSSQLPTP